MSLYVAGCIWSIAGSIWTSFGSKLQTDPKKLAISEIISLIAKFTEPAHVNFAYGEMLLSSQQVFGLLAPVRAGGAFRSLSFIVLQLYNPKTTSKQCT
jgi:hypothetical protein